MTTAAPGGVGRDGRFAVWAPEATTVAVVVDGTAHPMARDEAPAPADRGWWYAQVGGTGHGTATPTPSTAPTRCPTRAPGGSPTGSTPRRGCGIRRRRRCTGQTWTGRALPGAVIYEMHVGTFTPGGTFDAAVERLDHLVELGITHVEVLPVNAFDGSRGWGYDGVLWFAVTENYGGPDGFRRFVAGCHERGLAVVLDAVYNHLGPSGAYLDRFGPYFFGENVVGALAQPRRTRLGHRPRVHPRERRDVVRRLRGGRAAPRRGARAARRPGDPPARGDGDDRGPARRDAGAAVRAHRRVRPQRPAADQPREAGGYGLDAQWCDDIHHALHSTLTGETQGYYVDFGELETLARVLREAYVHAGTWSTFRGRGHGRPVDLARTPGYRFLAYLQDHDQVGNRAAGDRLSASLSPGLLACGAALVFCSPFTPMVFMGEEWGASTPWAFFVGFDDPALAEAVRTGRREEFAEHGWGAADVPDPTDIATFERSKLDWSEPAEGQHAWLLEVYRSLIALRRTEPELADPRLDRVRCDADPGARTLVLHRGSLRLVVNLAAEERTVAVDGAHECLAAPVGAGVSEGAVTLAPESFALVRVG